MTKINWNRCGERPKKNLSHWKSKKANCLGTFLPSAKSLEAKERAACNQWRRIRYQKANKKGLEL